MVWLAKNFIWKTVLYISQQRVSIRCTNPQIKKPTNVEKKVNYVKEENHKPFLKDLLRKRNNLPVPIRNIMQFDAIVFERFIKFFSDCDFDVFFIMPIQSAWFCYLLNLFSEMINCSFIKNGTTAWLKYCFLHLGSTKMQFS